MFLKYKHPKIDDHYLYYLKTDNYQTTPVDLTSFILDRIDKNKDISEFIENFESLGIENDIPSYFQNYMSIADVELTSSVLAPIAHKIETFIKSCNNFDLDNFKNELIIYINQLNEDEIVDALFANRLIWNYLNDEYKLESNLKSFKYIDSINPNEIDKLKSIAIHFFLKTSDFNLQELNSFKLNTKPNVVFYHNDDNKIYLEIDHESKTVWFDKETSDWINRTNTVTFDGSCDFDTLIHLYFLLSETVLSGSNKEYNMKVRSFKPVWFRAMGYTVKPSGEYAKTYWKIIEQQIN